MSRFIRKVFLYNVCIGNVRPASYTELFQSLKNKGLKKTSLFISDAHQGLKNTIVKNFSGSSWQRYKVHFMRNCRVRGDR